MDHLVDWLLLLLVMVMVMYVTPCSGLDRQRHDGWYNNLANPSWGAKGDDIIFTVPAAYSDLAYMPAGADRPNPRHVSNLVIQGSSGTPAYHNKTTMWVFFGQVIAYEVVHSTEQSCPAEVIRVPVDPEDAGLGDDTTEQAGIPFVRSKFNRDTGRSGNNPRKPKNEISSFIDGSFIYGPGEVWCNCLREFSRGRLVCSEAGYPGNNKMRLPMENFPDPITHRLHNPQHRWMAGDAHAHQTPGLLALSITWFRYHNLLAEQLHLQHPDWSDDRLFQVTRRKVIATLQKIIMYDWLPLLLGEDLPPYTGYKSYVHPGISALFEAAAFRFGHSMIPPGFYLRDQNCTYRRPDNRSSIRLCNAYWRSQDVIEQYGLEEILLGMASQIAEREDTTVIDDLRNNCYGPLHFNRVDLAVLTIMRGRDHGLPDYNTVRRHLNLPVVETFEDINPELAAENPQLFERVKEAYNSSIDTLDVYIGGLLEFTSSGAGPVFRAVLVDQFTRLRDGDRFWFENMHNMHITEEDVADIKATTFADVIKAVLNITRDDVIQDNVFYWEPGDPCQQPAQVTEEDVESCTKRSTFDYFWGSEIAYIMAFTTLGLFPFGCALFAWLLYKTRVYIENRRIRREHARRVEVKRAKLAKKNLNPNDIWITLVSEWKGKDEPVDKVELLLCPESCVLQVSSLSGRALRKISLRQMYRLNVITSSDHSSNVLWIQVPKEYDLILIFDTNKDRQHAQEFLASMLLRYNIPMTSADAKLQYIHHKAVTRSKRQELLVRFFRAAFVQANVLKDSNTNAEIKECKEILRCNISREEFAEALSEPPDSLFVNQLFDFINKNDSDYISFQDLVYFVVLCSKDCYESKWDLLFLLFDSNKDGAVCREEVTTMIRSMLCCGQSILCEKSAEELTNDIFVSAGLEDKMSLTLTDFRSLFKESIFRNINIDFKGTRKMCDRRKSSIKLPPLPTYLATAPVESGDLTYLASTSSTAQLCVPEMSLTTTWRRVRHYVENKRQQLVYAFVFFAITAILVFERVFRYMYLTDHKGFRAITGYGIAFTRGAAAGMCFTYSVLLLTMCRNTMTYLRDTVLNQYVPFDSSVAFHKMVAWTALLFTLCHILGYTVNFYLVSTQPVDFLCIFDEIYFKSESLPDFAFWVFGNLTGFTGFLLVLLICVLYIFALPCTRRRLFHYFWITHKLFYLIFLCTLLHGCSRVVQSPDFPYYFIGPAILFLADKTKSLSGKKQKLKIIKCQMLPSDVTYLEFQRPPQFDYKSGQWVRLACVELGSNEYHPFTLTSAPQEDTLKLHIRAVGPWTNHLKKLLEPENLRDKPYPKLYIDGPFGGSHQDWYRYEVAVLVGAGIGVTPAASVLKDFVHMASSSNLYRMKCKKLYFVWVTNSQRHFEWLIDILHQVERADQFRVVETHIFITQVFQLYDLRTTMMYLCEEHFQKTSNKSLFTGLQATTHFGRPDFARILRKIKQEQAKVREVGVFSCGPPGLTKQLETTCLTESSPSKAFQHHYENF